MSAKNTEMSFPMMMTSGNIEDTNKASTSAVHPVVGSLENFRVTKVPNTIYYLPDFITKDEEEELKTRIYSVPKPKWTCLSKRRLQNWGGLPHPKGMITEPLPTWLSVYASRIASLGVFQSHVPNHVLINEYKPGQGIMPHEDGPLFYPVVTTINLGSHTVLEFYEKLDGPTSSVLDYSNPALEDEKQTVDCSLQKRRITSLLLEPRSLLIVQDDMYHKYLHGIREIESDLISEDIGNINACHARIGETLQRSVRISVTVRYVPNTLKTKILLRPK